MVDLKIAVIVRPWLIVIEHALDLGMLLKVVETAREPRNFHKTVRPSGKTSAFLPKSLIHSDGYRKTENLIEKAIESRYFYGKRWRVMVKMFRLQGSHSDGSRELGKLVARVKGLHG